MTDSTETNYDDEEFDDGDSWGSRGSRGGGGGGGGGGGENFLGTGLLESKSSMVSMGGSGGGGGSGGEIFSSSLSRVASIKKFSAMNNDVETYIQTRAEDYEQMMSNTFNQKTSMGTPPVSRPPKDDDDDNDSGDGGGDGGDNPFGSSSSNPFASSSDMFDKTFSN